MARSPDSPPIIMLSLLPKSEQRASHYVNGLLSRLYSYVGQFEAALSLFDFSNDQIEAVRTGPKANVPRTQELHRWKLMAARDSAMTVYHFGKTTGGIRRSLSKMPTLRSKVDETKLRNADKLLRKTFPDFEKFRHAISHAGDFGHDEDSYHRHGIRTAFGRGMVSNHLRDRTLSFTIAGQLVRFEISRENLLALNSSKLSYYAAFKSAFYP